MSAYLVSSSAFGSAYDELKERKENDQAALDELKLKITDLKHIRYNYEILERDSAPNSNQHVIPKDHHYAIFA